MQTQQVPSADARACFVPFSMTVSYFVLALGTNSSHYGAVTRRRRNRWD